MSHRPDRPGPTATGDPPRPEAPARAGELSGPSIRYSLRRAIRAFFTDGCPDLAAALTFYAMLALFPTAIALLSLVGLVGQSRNTVDTLMTVMSDLGAAPMADTIEPTLESLSRTPGAGLALFLGLAGALWSSSAYVGAFGRAMNRVYGIREGRPIWKLRPMMLLLTLVLVVLTALVLLALVVSGPVAQSIGNELGMSSTAQMLWQVVKWPVLLVTVVVIVAMLYQLTPNVEQRTFRWLSAGALIAIVVWIVASAGFGFYLSSFSNFNKTYGSLAGVIVFLLWLWITNLALLFGGELDVELERGRQLEAGVAAEEMLQLPARDASGIERAEKKDAKEIHRGRRLRRNRGNGETSDV